MPRKLVVEIVGDASNLEHVFKRSGASSRTFGQTVRRSAGIAALALGGVLVTGLQKSVKAAMHGEAAQAALDTALKNTGQALAAVTGPLKRAEAASRKLGFADDESRASLAKLEVATGSTRKAIKDLALAEDISRFKKISLDAATKLLTSTLAGNARGAKAFGLILLPVTTHMDALKAKFKALHQAIPPVAAVQAKLLDKQATGAAAIAKLTAKVHGQAKAFADTAAGGMAQFHAQTQHLEEALGGGLLPALTRLAEIGAKVAEFFSKHTTLAKALVIGLASLAAVLGAVAIAEKLYAAGEAIAIVATAAWTAAQWLLNAALTANPIGVVIVGLVAFGAAMVLAWKHSARFRHVVIGAFHAIRGAARTMGAAVVRVLRAVIRVYHRLMKAGTQLEGSFKAMWNSLKKHTLAFYHWLQRMGLKIALAIIEPFSHLPGFMGGGKFREIKEGLEEQLADLEGTSARGGKPAKKTRAGRVVSPVAGVIPGAGGRLRVPVPAAHHGQGTGGKGQPIVVHTHVHLDGKKVAENTTMHQIRRERNSATQRRGRFAGRGG
jgi:hypothetical protein